MSTRYPGGLISRSKPVIVGPINGEGGSAPGVWTLEQASYYTKQGTWPKPPLFGELWDCGNGNFGSLGRNNQIDYSSPVQVGSDTNWSLVSCGAYITAATKTNGTLWTWGSNTYGGLGQGNVVSLSSPVQVGALTNWKNISAGVYHVWSVKTDGTLWSWGYNASGQLGIGNVAQRSSPVQVGSETNWVQSGCTDSSSLAVKSNGTLWACGDNSYGQLGDGTRINRSSPVQIGSSNDWLVISVCNNSSLSIKTNGTLWAWGSNGFGQLGQNTAYTINRSSPVQVGALTTWLSINAGYAHVVAIKTDGTLWSWGLNSSGQLGDGTIVNRSSPVQISSATNWSSIFGSCYAQLSAATKTDGTLWSWGMGTSGGLGQGNVVNKSSPVQVGNLTTWKKGSTGTQKLFAIKS